MQQCSVVLDGRGRNKYPLKDTYSQTVGVDSIGGYRKGNAEEQEQVVKDDDPQEWSVAQDTCANEGDEPADLHGCM